MRAFAFEPLLAASGERDVQELDRHPPIERAIGALREPDRPHAAASDRRAQRVGAERLTYQRRLPGECAWTALEEPFGDQVPVFVEKGAQLVGQSRIFFTHRLQIGVTVVAGHPER